MLRIALPNKGRLVADARELFASAGLPVAPAGDRALTTTIGGEHEALFLRAADIPEFVANGAADAGVTGWDLICEAGCDVASRLDLGFGSCRLVVAVLEEAPIKCSADIPSGSRVASAFPRLARSYFDSLGVQVDIVSITGAAEVAPRLGIADVIVDITSSGSTLRSNGLRQVATVVSSTAHLISRREIPSTEGESALLDVTGALRSVVLARGQRYVMANLPRSALAEVREVLPGLNGPTVLDVMNGGGTVAVHAVVPADSLHRTISRLKKLGGTGVLVTRIERLMP